MFCRISDIYQELVRCGAWIIIVLRDRAVLTYVFRFEGDKPIYPPGIPFSFMAMSPNQMTGTDFAKRLPPFVS
jgi:hypothetical protein